MPTYFNDLRHAQDNSGRSQSGALVYWLTDQPAATPATVNLALTVPLFSSSSGGSIANPVPADGNGDSAPYLSPGTYTIAIVYFGKVQVVYPGQPIIGGGGAVVSVGLTMPADTFSVANSPVTSAGTFTVTEITQNAGFEYTGPKFAPAAAPTWKPGYKKQVFNVLTYGADPTGVADSTSAFQACITAACAYNPISQSSGTVYVPTGTYIISSTLTDTGQGIGGIWGDPGGLSILQVPNSSATNAMFNFTNCNTIGGIVRDLVFVGPANYTTDNCTIFALTAGVLQDWTFDNLRYFQWGKTPLNLAGPIVCKISNIRCLFTTSGILCAQGTSTVVTDCYMLQTLQIAYHFSAMAYSSLIGCASDFAGLAYVFEGCVACSWVSCGHEAGTALTSPVFYSAVSGTACTVNYTGPDMSDVFYFNMPVQISGTTNGMGILNGRWRVDSVSPNAVNFVVNPGIAPFSAGDTGTISFFPGDGFQITFSNSCMGYNCTGTDSIAATSTDFILSASFNSGFRDCVSSLANVGVVQTYNAYLGGTDVAGLGFGFNNNLVFLDNFQGTAGSGIAGQGQLARNATESIYVAGNKATSGANQSAPGIGFFSNYWDGAANATDIWEIAPGLGNGANPSSALTFTHSGPPSSFAGVNFILGNASNSGSVGLIQNTAATVDSNYFSPELGLTGNFWDLASLNNTDTYLFVNEVQPGQEPQSILTLLHDGSGNSFVLTVAGNASAGNTTYTGTFQLGSNAYAGQTVIISGFSTEVGVDFVNNGEFTVVSNTTTSMVVDNPNGVAEAGVVGANAYVVTFPGNAKFNVGVPFSLLGSTIAAPTSAGTAGTAGDMVYFGTHLYLCTVTGVAGAATWSTVNLTGV